MWQQALAAADLAGDDVDRYPLLVGLATSLYRAGNIRDGLPVFVQAIECPGRGRAREIGLLPVGHRGGRGHGRVELVPGRLRHGRRTVGRRPAAGAADRAGPHARRHHGAGPGNHHRRGAALPTAVYTRRLGPRRPAMLAGHWEQAEKLSQVAYQLHLQVSWIGAHARVRVSNTESTPRAAIVLLRISRTATFKDLLLEVRAEWRAGMVSGPRAASAGAVRLGSR
jgi:hypothetical protein